MELPSWTVVCFGGFPNLKAALEIASFPTRRRWLEVIEKRKKVRPNCVLLKVELLRLAEVYINIIIHRLYPIPPYNLGTGVFKW